MNNNNNLTGVILGAVIVILAIGGVFWYQNQKVMQEGEKNKGAIFIGITDATADINNVNEVSMEVKKVEIYSATSGWTTISNRSNSYNLLFLNIMGKTELYAESRVVAGAYDRVRVTLGDTVVKTKTNGDIKAYSPSSQVVMNMNVMVRPQGGTLVKLDFLADKSLHITTDNKYVFAPVVKAESHSSSEVMIDNENGAIESVGGVLDSSVSVGVDIDGTTRGDYILDSANGLRVDDTHAGRVDFILGNQIYMNNKEVQESVNRNIDTDLSINVDSEKNVETNIGGALSL